MSHAIAVPVGTTHFINALSKDSQTFVALGATLVNRRTEEEAHLDLLVDDDRIGTVFKAIRKRFSSDWDLHESWEIEPTEQQSDELLAA